MLFAADLTTFDTIFPGCFRTSVSVQFEEDPSALIYYTALHCVSYLICIGEFIYIA